MYLSGPLWIIGILCILYLQPGKGEWIAISIIFFGFLIDIAPAVYLYKEYSKVNKDAKFDLHPDERKLKYYSDNEPFIQ